jgi:nitroimidazol reductase NimA-like FMN-containing flavoprotein (pyridoxamine 5'-phosphate oxidase superfamily)
MNTAPLVLSPSDRTVLRRRAGRSTDLEVFDDVLAEALVCQVAVLLEGAPLVLPTTFVRLGDEVFVHGAVGNRMLKLAVDAPVCFSATIVDGLVFSKAASHHSMNYRSVVAFGRGRDVVELDDKARVLNALLDKMRPGRSSEARPMTTLELQTVRVVAIGLHEASSKQRQGPPVDDDDDKDFATWSGVAPVLLVTGPVE